ncbi:MAG: DUF3631 domain-containing protein [Gammaproteobacteria bacterium]
MALDPSIYTDGWRPHGRDAAAAADGGLPPRREVVRRILAANFAELARLDAVAYDRCRKTAAQNLDIRVETLDLEVAKHRPQTADAGPPFPYATNDMPAADAVDGEELLNEISATFARYVALPKHAADVLALWIVHTYGLDAAGHAPILALTSPTPRCGKTTCESVARSLAYRALPSSNLTGSVVFHAVELWHPTLIIDEADTFMGENEELRGIINSGHTRGMASTLRNEKIGEKYVPQPFGTWCAKMIACIGKLSPTLTDRSIEIKLRRRLPSEIIERFRSDKFDGSSIRGMILRWVADHRADLGTEAATPAGLNDRAADNWRPLLTIAAVAGGVWFVRAKAAALALSDEVEEENAGVQLLADVAALFSSRDVAKLGSAEIVGHLIELEDRPWPEWARGKPLTARQLAKLLNGFEIKPKLLRDGSRVSRGYTFVQFADALARYTLLPSVTELQPSNGVASSDFLSVTPEKPVTLPKPMQATDGVACNGVTLKAPPTRAGDEPSLDDLLAVDRTLAGTLEALDL